MTYRSDYCNFLHILWLRYIYRHGWFVFCKLMASFTLREWCSKRMMPLRFLKAYSDGISKIILSPFSSQVKWAIIIPNLTFISIINDIFFRLQLQLQTSKPKITANPGNPLPDTSKNHMTKFLERVTLFTIVWKSTPLHPWERVLAKDARKSRHRQTSLRGSVNL